MSNDLLKSKFFYQTGPGEEKKVILLTGGDVEFRLNSTEVFNFSKLLMKMLQFAGLPPNRHLLTPSFAKSPDEHGDVFDCRVRSFRCHLRWIS